MPSRFRANVQGFCAVAGVGPGGGAFFAGGLRDMPATDFPAIAGDRWRGRQGRGGQRRRIAVKGRDAGFGPARVGEEYFFREDEQSVFLCGQAVRPHRGADRAQDAPKRRAEGGARIVQRPEPLTGGDKAGAPVGAGDGDRPCAMCRCRLTRKSPSPRRGRKGPWRGLGRRVQGKQDHRPEPERKREHHLAHHRNLSPHGQSGWRRAAKTRLTRRAAGVGKGAEAKVRGCGPCRKCDPLRKIVAARCGPRRP